MRCDFCSTKLPDAEPANVALLRHVALAPACDKQFHFMIENLNASWTPAMSGG